MRFRMDWRSIKFDWNRARAFLVTAEEGSLSAAARALGMAQPTLGRQVNALEDELGVALFERTGRGLELTPSGLELIDHVRAMGDAATQVSLAASGQSQVIAGQVTITASEIYAAYLLPPVIAELRDTAPGLDIEISATNAVTDLRRREADVAIRNTEPEDPVLIGKRIANDTGWFYASDAYLARRGTPQGLDDLAGHDFVAMDTADQMIAAFAGFDIHLTREMLTIRSDNHLVHWQLATQGVAIGIAPDFLGQSTPGMERLLPGFGPITYPVWLVAHREVQSSRRIRLVWDTLERHLRARLASGDEFDQT
ncbi:MULTISPECIES: LysR family transcriptional regulator [Roseobacteraceae]|nr:MULTISPECIES: LysR family transcriptional regulator [Roseobacteraceae]MCJ7872348.1 LysR family transcriptional regulator [Phaeobacter sp. J2-8]